MAGTPRHTVGKLSMTRQQLWPVAAGWLLAAGVAAHAVDGAAQSAERVAVQPVAPIFQFQARVSQARAPSGGGAFPRICVYLEETLQRRTLCSQTFERVVVEHGVLNLRLDDLQCGENRSVADIMAHTNDPLALLACIGNDDTDTDPDSDNCLEPVPLGTVPFSLSAHVAEQVARSYRADASHRSEIAHRATASEHLLNRSTQLVGYFDFSSYWECDEQDCGLQGFEAQPTDGFITWVPVAGSKRLNVCWSDSSMSRAPYTALGVYAYLASFKGGLSTLGNARVAGNLEVGSDARLAQVAAGLNDTQRALCGGPTAEELAMCVAAGLVAGTALEEGSIAAYVAADASVGQGLSVAGKGHWGAPAALTSVSGNLVVSPKDALGQNGSEDLLKAGASVEMKAGLRHLGSALIGTTGNLPSVQFCRDVCPAEPQDSGLSTNLPTQFVNEVTVYGGTRFYGLVSFTDPMLNSGGEDGTGLALDLPSEVELANNMDCDGCIDVDDLAHGWRTSTLSLDGTGDVQSADLGHPVRCDGLVVDHAGNKRWFVNSQWGYAQDPEDCLAELDTEGALAMTAAECAVVAADGVPKSLELRPMARCCPADDCSQRINPMWCAECNVEWVDPTNLSCEARCFYLD